MFIIPIGHDKLYRRLPLITIVLIGLNVIIWIITYPIELRQESNIRNLFDELRKIEYIYLIEYVQKHPDAFKDPHFQENFHKSIENGEIIEKDSKNYAEWETTNKRFKQYLNGRIFYRFGFKPKRFSFITIISSMFIHASFFHLFFNILFLWLVGVNIEDYWGRPLFLGFYVIGGIVATLFYAIFNLSSNVPLIGASGAISAVMGAFAFRFYKTKIRFFYFFIVLLRPFWGTFELYAWFALAFWFAEQLFYAMVSKSIFTGVAFFAHVGGFLFGLICGGVMKFLKVEEKYISDRIEEKLEGVKLNPKLEKAFQMRDEGDIDKAIELLQEVIKAEPRNTDARLELARSLTIVEKKREASGQYEKLLAQLYENGKMERLQSIYLEVYEKEYEIYFSPKSQFRIGTFLASKEDYRKAIELFSRIVRKYPDDRLAPAALLKTGKIFLCQLGDEKLGKGSLEFLIKNYPQYSGISEAKLLLSEHK